MNQSKMPRQLHWEIARIRSNILRYHSAADVDLKDAVVGQALAGLQTEAAGYLKTLRACHNYYDNTEQCVSAKL
jgi:hypothetical protein